MKTNQKQMKNSSIHSIRDSVMIYDEYLTIFVETDHSLAIAWSISSTTTETLGHLLSEDFVHLHKSIVIYRINNEDYLEFPFAKSVGKQVVNNFQSDQYYCEMIIRNSQNQAITIKRSNTMQLIQGTDSNLAESYIWKKKNVQQDDWTCYFSGYTIYEKKG